MGLRCSWRRCRGNEGEAGVESWKEEIGMALLLQFGEDDVNATNSRSHLLSCFCFAVKSSFDADFKFCDFVDA
jgi:hypothetical protein